jgi:hypothetical protein
MEALLLYYLHYVANQLEVPTMLYPKHENHHLSLWTI